MTEDNPDLIGDGNNRLTVCYNRMNEAEDNLNLILSFSNAYLSSAFKLHELVSQSANPTP